MRGAELEPGPRVLPQVQQLVDYGNKKRAARSKILGAPCLCSPLKFPISMYLQHPCKDGQLIALKLGGAVCPVAPPKEIFPLCRQAPARGSRCDALFGTARDAPGAYDIRQLSVIQG